jgi:hypothetical protein
VVLALAAAEASGAEVRPLLDVAAALERTVLTGVPFWVEGASAAVVLPCLAVVTLLEGVSVVVVVVVRLVPVLVCLRTVLVSVFEDPVLRRAAVPVLFPLLVVPLLRFTWLPVLVPVLVLLPRRTWVEVLPAGAAVLRLAVLV